MMYKNNEYELQAKAYRQSLRNIERRLNEIESSGHDDHGVYNGLKFARKILTSQFKFAKMVYHTEDKNKKYM